MMEFVIMLVFNRKAVAGTWTMSSRYRVGIHPLCKPSYLGWQMQRYVLYSVWSLIQLDNTRLIESFLCGLFAISNMSFNVALFMFALHM